VKIARYLRLCTLVFAVPLGSVAAKPPECQIEPFRGATLPQGTVAHMRVANTGKPCVITNHGVPAERSNPADSGTITKQPAHGKAEFVAPQAKYTPERGYAGEDEFAYEAFARGKGEQRVRLKVQVKVAVAAP
jgi:hypothetical protein